jgi:hypothetical protein
MKVDRQFFIKQKLFQFRPHISRWHRGAWLVLTCLNGAKSFSPALADEIGLRWVVAGTGKNSERVASGQRSI